jgi:hypothetical protein
MSKAVDLVHPHQTFQIPGRVLVLKCQLFGNDPRLLGFPYAPKSKVSLDDFRQFVSALEGTAVTINNNNFKGLSLLSTEFDFGELASQLSAFRNSGDFKEQTIMEDSEAYRRLSELEERVQHRDAEIELLQCAFSRQSQTQTSAIEALTGRMGRLEAEVAAVRSDAKPATGTLPDGEKVKDSSNQSAPDDVVASLGRLQSDVGRLWGKVGAMDSVIISGFPDIFLEFRASRFSLLWRGSRDGFPADEFHRRCDGHANTLTVILDTNGNIFGGFTPVEWESRQWNGKSGSESNCRKADPTLKSFLFTLKNPDNFPARRFGLRLEERGDACLCDSRFGPNFYDIGFGDDCSAGRTWHFGSLYNDGGLNPECFTGLSGFTVKEIEVFEITQLEPSLMGLQADLNTLTDLTVTALKPGMDSQIIAEVHSWQTVPVIISDFPDIFSEFRGSRFSLLWRGSRDGFHARDFHTRCDGHANTLTILLDINGNVFGGFTPVEWESRTSAPYSKADPSRRSFVFTLKNPHNVPARKFALKAEQKDQAIVCDYEWGPGFFDFRVSNNCNANTASSACLGYSYTNDTRLDGNIFFAGLELFQVKDIEVFEI